MYTVFGKNSLQYFVHNFNQCKHIFMLLLAQIILRLVLQKI